MNQEVLQWSTTMTENTKQKYYAVVDEWLANGYRSAEAYQSVYPKASRKTAQTKFCKIKQIPAIAEYINERRKEAFDAKLIDIQRVTEEIASMAFIELGNTNVPSSVKLKALELLQKAMLEEAKNNNNNKDDITIGLEGDEEDEDNIEEESIQ